MLPSLFADVAVPVAALTRAAESHDWWTVALTLAGLAVVNLGLITGARLALRRRFPFFRSGRGARVLTALVTGVEALALTLAAGIPVDRAGAVSLFATALASGARSWKPKKKRPESGVAVPPAAQEPTP